ADGTSHRGCLSPLRHCLGGGLGGRSPSFASPTSPGGGGEWAFADLRNGDGGSPRAVRLSAQWRRGEPQGRSTELTKRGTPCSFMTRGPAAIRYRGLPPKRRAPGSQSTRGSSRDIPSTCAGTVRVGRLASPSRVPLRASKSLRHRAATSRQRL